MKNKVETTTYLGISAIAITFLASEIGLDYLIDTKATLGLKIWFTVLVVLFYYIISTQITNLKK